MPRVVEFTVMGEQRIHCAGCEERIRRVLRRSPGVNSVPVNLVDGVVLSRPTCPRSAGRSVLQGPALIQRCHDESRNDR